jgi:uncharacterized protein (DUF1800 family)
MIDAKMAWKPYQPEAGNAWTLAKVAHLYRRAAFGATWDELQAGLKDGPEKTIDRLIQGSPVDNRFDADTSNYLRDTARRANDGDLASAWWLQQMCFSADPFREKITLFWHNHFATSQAKVQSVDYMLGQYDLLRQHALGQFDEMLQGISKDPAMLVWLDTIQSKKGKPNENYARELMELFSLGIGNYTEKDIREAAKAFTGWEIANGKYRFNTKQHDVTTKTVFGKSDNFNGDGIVKLCLEHPACAKFIISKLYRYLISETDVIDPKLIEPLVTSFRQDYHIGKLVETMIRSNLFFSESAYRQRIQSPVEYGVGLVRAMEADFGAANNTVNLAETMQSLGQHLFFPPSVKGWDGGPAWLNAQTLLARQNFALAVCEKRSDGTPLPLKLLRRLGKNSPKEQVDTLVDLFLGGDLNAQAKQKLLDYATQSRTRKFPSYWGKDHAEAQPIIGLAHLTLCVPEYQLA